MPHVPTIHSNGSELRSAYEDVARAILELSAKIQAAAPHARDYYLQQGSAYHHAVNEHMAQLAALDKVRIHYMELLEGVRYQIAQRAPESEAVLRVLSEGPATARNISRTAALSFTTVMTILRDLAKEGIVRFTASRWEKTS